MNFQTITHKAHLLTFKSQLKYLIDMKCYYHKENQKIRLKFNI
jgi:hypothetical protein